MASLTLNEVLRAIHDMLRRNPDILDKPLTAQMKDSDAHPVTVEGIDIRDNGMMVLICENETVNMEKRN